MPLFPSISKNDRLPIALAKFNTGVEKPLMQLHDVLMRSEDSPFSIAERELLAAYVSGIMNDCGYCVNIHSMIAIQFGIKEGLLESLLGDLEKADMDENFKPILRYVKKLTLEPTKMTQADSDAVYNAGWSERALYDAMLICCTWNFMNRFVEGVGLDVDPEQYKESAKMLMTGYLPVIEKFNLK